MEVTICPKCKIDTEKEICLIGHLSTRHGMDIGKAIYLCSLLEERRRSG